MPYSMGLDAEVIGETDKAIHVDVDGVRLWVPKSVIHDNSEVWKSGQSPGELVVMHWWAEKNTSAVKQSRKISDWESF